MNFLSSLHQTVEPVLAKAEGLTLHTFLKKHDISIKEGLVSQSALASEVDQQVDELFRTELTQLFPEFGFITEENDQSIIKEYNWIIDPIDGTTNFIHQIPLYGISVALWHENQPVYGCLSLPQLKQRLYAWQGGGVWLNQKKFVSPPEPFAQQPLVLVAPALPPQQHGEFIRKVSQALSGPRDLGCCVYQAFEVCAGRADVLIVANLSLWDIGAALAIAQEIGLSVHYFSQKPDIHNLEQYAYNLALGKKQCIQSLEKVDLHFSASFQL